MGKNCIEDNRRRIKNQHETTEAKRNIQFILEIRGERKTRVRSKIT
jgi:hypothetical protein